MKNPFAFFSARAEARRQAEVAAEEQRKADLELEFRIKARRDAMSNLHLRSKGHIYHTLPKESFTSQVYHTL